MANNEELVAQEVFIICKTCKKPVIPEDIYLKTGECFTCRKKVKKI